ncbi:uncharacterized protein CMU_037030 [Cryptosporidium muris RN66]|uniref:Uncharacterized protein n=1 Tax=Cryptosporidium muris (strain RN66) TaxID=441375 RepID=B6AH38_CRYMR|nr:uncharacterized protein CMU_037030 [Cryptosporidium muris RN66]EEA07529.1 hypothetical protein CMU_037030 [Cryptosporidium muris RN66]|eukprot:XP_002141878.1 hypothetical protein [Cryptosporidium muris RN66]
MSVISGLDFFLNGTSIPPISGKLLYGFKNKKKSMEECVDDWKNLSVEEKNIYNSECERLYKLIFKNIKPLQPWDFYDLKQTTPSHLFYFHNYASQQAIYPELSDDEIWRKCSNKLLEIKRDEKVSELFKSKSSEVNNYLQMILREELLSEQESSDDSSADSGLGIKGKLVQNKYVEKELGKQSEVLNDNHIEGELKKQGRRLKSRYSISNSD